MHVRNRFTFLRKRLNVRGASEIAVRSICYRKEFASES